MWRGRGYSEFCPLHRIILEGGGGRILNFTFFFVCVCFFFVCFFGEGGGGWGGRGVGEGV